MILTAIGLRLVASGQQKSPSVRTGELLTDLVGRLESEKPCSGNKKWDRSRFSAQRLRDWPLRTSSATTETATTIALTSALFHIDMVFHLLFEENCGLQQRNPRLM
jgi:hypothetical protein